MLSCFLSFQFVCHFFVIFLSFFFVISVLSVIFLSFFFVILFVISVLSVIFFVNFLSFFLSFQFCLSFFCQLFFCHFSFVCHFACHFSKNFSTFVTILRKLQQNVKKMTNFPQNDKKMSKNVIFAGSKNCIFLEEFFDLSHYFGKKIAYQQ